MRGLLVSFITVLGALSALDAGAEPSAVSRLTWVTNGTVRAATVHEQTLYIGGRFTRVAPAANFLGPWFGVSTTTGVPVPRLPLADAAVLAIEPDGAGGYYVGGRFTRIGGVLRPALAHVLADGSIDPGFAPTLQPGLASNGLDVRALARAGNLLYVGGNFRIMAGSSVREGMAALDPVTGADQTSFPTRGGAERILVHDGRAYFLGSGVTALTTASGSLLWTSSGLVTDGVVAGGRLVVVGRFLVGITTETRLARIDLTSGAIDPSWTPISSYTQPGPPDNTPIRAVTAIGSTIYIGGRFSHLNGQPRSNLAAVDVVSGTLTPWSPDAQGVVHDLAPASGTSVYVAGAFRRIGAAAREALAEIDAAGAVTAWSSQAYSTEIHTLYPLGGTLLAGGRSAVAGGVAREHLAAFALDADDVLPWAPAPTSDVLDLATDGVNVFVGTCESAAPSLPGVVAFDAATGAASSWTAPENTHKLLTVHDGGVYLTEFAVSGAIGREALVRADAERGTLDTAWRIDGGWDSQLRGSGDVLYLFGRPHIHYSPYRKVVSAVHARTAELGQMEPQLGGIDMVFAAAVMGRTMYVASERGLAGFDRESGLPVMFLGATGMSVLDVAAADGLVFTAGMPATVADGAAAAFFPDGTRTAWNPGLVPTEPVADSLRGWSFEGRWRIPATRVVATPADLVVIGVQSLGGTPVHGVAVFARQPSPAPTTLDATVVDNAVRLTWIASEPAVGSYTIEAGSTAGAADMLAQDTGSSLPTFEAVAPSGTYFVRVRASGAAPGAQTAPTNEIALRVGCMVPPSSPTRLSALVAGPTVTLSWEAPAFVPAVRYVLEAGSTAGLTNLARLVLPAAQTTFATDAPAGTYFVRVRAENACGASAPSSEVWLTVGGDPLPAAPTGLTITDLTPGMPGGGHSYQVHWTPVAGASAYRLEVGFRPGLADLVSTMVSATSVGPAVPPSGQRLFLRVRAVTSAGVGPPSPEYVLVTP